MTKTSLEKLEEKFNEIISYVDIPDDPEESLKLGVAIKKTRNLIRKTYQTAIEDCIKLSEDMESGKDTSHDEWRAFKGFRNALVDKIKTLEEK